MLAALVSSAVALRQTQRLDMDELMISAERASWQCAIDDHIEADRQLEAAIDQAFQDMRDRHQAQEAHHQAERAQLQRQLAKARHEAQALRERQSVIDLFQK